MSISNLTTTSQTGFLTAGDDDQSMTIFHAPVAKILPHIASRPLADADRMTAAARELALGNDECPAADESKPEMFIIDELVAHQPDPDVEATFQIRVRWKGGRETWEPEWNLQEDAPMSLFKYWNGVEGGRQSQMAGRDLWHVFKVLDYRRRFDTVELQVAWVGSPKASWEPAANIQVVAGELVDEYWASVGCPRTGSDELAAIEPVVKYTPREMTGSRKKGTRGRCSGSGGVSKPRRVSTQHADSQLIKALMRLCS